MNESNQIAVKGTNGVMDGHANAKRFELWAKEVVDFKPYVYQGGLSITRMARESGLKRDVFYTNAVIRDSLLPELISRLESLGALKCRVAQPAHVLTVDRAQSRVSDARHKQIQEENEALKAEIEELRRELSKYQGMTDVLYSCGRLPW